MQGGLNVLRSRQATSNHVDYGRISPLITTALGLLVFHTGHVYRE